jgi:DAACS family dicarboxylate/amino acid:cation (Na+ or H+) symporter
LTDSLLSVNSTSVRSTPDYYSLLIAHIFVPGDYLRPLIANQSYTAALKNMDFIVLISHQLPTSVVQPFVDNSMMPIVLLALMFGFAWRQVRHRQTHEKTPDQGGPDYANLADKAEVLISFAREITETVLIWIIKLIPLAVFAATAKVVSEQGLTAFKNLGQYTALCLLGMLIHVVFTYSVWLIVFVRINLLKFWMHALQPVLYAFSVNSSLVALPLTLRALDKLGVSRRASTLAACVGTNLNNDGIILYEGFTLIAIAQALGIDLSLSMQILAAVYCIIAAMGVAGVPEAGVVALTIVLGSLGLPAEVLALLLSVDWIIARGRSLLNANSDLVGSMILDRWIKLREPHPISTLDTAAPHSPAVLTSVIHTTENATQSHSQ